MQSLVPWSVALILVLGACPALAAPQPKPVPVRGQGCVAAGIEARCLIVRDLSSGKLYNLTFRGMPPTIGEGIEFEGLPHQGPTACMQGVGLDVLSWSPKDSLRCKQKDAHKK